MSEVVTNLFKHGSLFTLKIQRWAAEKKILPKQIKIDNPETAAKLFRLGSNMLIEKKYFSAINSEEQQARRLLKTNGKSFFIPSTYFVSSHQEKEVVTAIEDIKKTHNEVVQDFIDGEYQRAKEERLIAFNEYFSKNSDREEIMFFIEQWYPKPDELKKMFGIQYFIFSLKPTDDEIMTQIMESQVLSFVQDVASGLRSELLDLTEFVTETIKTGRKLSTKSISSLKEKIKVISSLNFAGDESLENLKDQLSNLILGVSSGHKANDVVISDITGLATSIKENMEYEITELAQSFGQLTTGRKLKVK